MVFNLRSSFLEMKTVDANRPIKSPIIELWSFTSFSFSILFYHELTINFTFLALCYYNKFQFCNN